MAQNWNNIINLVKSNLGSKSSNIEITDDEFITHFKEHTLPYFSQISPLQSWILLDGSNLVTLPNMHSRYVYKLPIPDGITIVDIVDVYFNSNFAITGTEFNEISARMTNNPADIVMANTLGDMARFLTTVNDYKFIKPDIIRFTESTRDAPLIVEINIEHNNPSTIPGDLYHKLFKNMTIVDGLELVLNNRNKFSNVTTPFGQIDLNTDYISQRIQELKQKNEEIIDGLPHRQFLEIF